MNALDTSLMRSLAETIRSVADDNDVSCVILTGAGRAFCAGGDTKAISKAASDRVEGKSPPKSTTEQRVRWLRRSAEASRLLHEMPKPTIAMINGACAGAGMSLAAACDLRYAAESAVFRASFTAFGMPGDYGGSWLWTQILGTAKARDLYFIDRKRSANEALDYGLVHGVFPDADIAGEVRKIAEKIASLPPTGFMYAKENLNAAVSETFAQALDRESRNMMLARNALVEARKAAEASKQSAE
jgi:2-(1,2-epoxy-1,2-dihydrophenyl)acetyl-CoA isomerase